MPRSLLRLTLAIVLATPLATDPSAADTCTRDTLRRVVDEAGARLRVITAETQPRIMAALRRLKEKPEWQGPEGDEKAAALMSDERTSELDTKAATLLALIDELSETSSTGSPDCSRLAELEAAALELQATVKAKAKHILDRLERETGGTSGPKTADASPRSQPTPPRPGASPQPSPPPPREASRGEPLRSKDVPGAGAEPQAPLRRAEDGTAPSSALPSSSRRADAAPPPKTFAPSSPGARPSPHPLPPQPTPAVKPAPQAHSGWSTESSERTQLPPPSISSAPLPPAAPSEPGPRPQGPAMGGPPPAPHEVSESFTRDEIREATRGFFGTISGGLANVMEHAFSTLGRPTGYVLGSEGGGAFIAGLRYGKGTLFLRDGSKRLVYWHGPSIGYDFGASGSKTLFLVYNLKNDIDIFTGFSGVDGSAYLVGGVGMTVLTDGKVIMAPIRSGLGVRLGANVGYIRFTARPTWNPF
ncbi:MAG: EipA family protein [Hyphomicrobiaceae bacterium]